MAETAQKLKKADLAQKVAASVDIVEVRLIETQAKQNIVGGNYPLNANLGRRSETKRDDDAESVVVRLSFLFDAKSPAEGQTQSSILLSATYELTYKVKGIKEYSNDEVAAFGEVNGCYNAWPFWREYVYSTLARMGLRPVTLPVFRYDEDAENADKNKKDTKE